MVSRLLEIKTNEHTYPVIIEQGCRRKTFEMIYKYLPAEPSAYFIITDDLVSELYLNDIINSFPESKRVERYIVPNGEKAKSFIHYEKIITAALESGLDRQSIIIALGGGVVGDLAGFVAATYMRGIPFVQIPTTLLAHDSSVGGKVGINHTLGKNMVGAFHQPALVLYDPECLLTLPENEWKSGFAEVIKHGFITGTDYLNWLDEVTTSLKEWDMEVLTEMLYRSIHVKAQIVEKDEKEKGIRAFLNFGHTLGHAIEAELGYGRTTHGEAVAIGIKFALELSERHFRRSLQYSPYIQKLTLLGYDLTIPEQLSPESLLLRMKTDKKASEGKVRFVLLKDIGSPELISVNDEEIIEVLKRGVG